VTKTYLARVTGRVTTADLRRLEEGVPLEDGPARAVSARMIDVMGDESLVEVVMVEGRNREVRRMFAAIGHEVTGLVRTAIGPIADPGLRPGQSRRLSPQEHRRLLATGHDG
jgi:pseudouridine synthase